MHKSSKEPNRVAFSFKLDGELMADLKALIRQLPYQPKLTQVVESGLRRERTALQSILSGKKRGNG